MNTPSKRSMERADKTVEQCSHLEFGACKPCIALAFDRLVEDACEVAEDWMPPFPLGDREFEATMTRNEAVAKAIRLKLKGGEE